MKFSLYRNLTLFTFMLIASQNILASALSNINDGDEIEHRTRFFQKNGFIVCEPLLFRDEKNSSKNHPQLKELSRTTIRDGLIYDDKGSLLHTGWKAFIYVLNHDGALYITENTKGVHHTHFLKSIDEKSGDEIGKNIACAGEIKIQGGKISAIDNLSGHYLPSESQLKIAVQFLSAKGVLTPSVKISAKEPLYEGGVTKQFSLDSIMREDAAAMLATYPRSIKRTPEYIEARRNAEVNFSRKLEHLRLNGPKAFLNRPVTDLIPDFKIPSGIGKVEFGTVELENKLWNAFMVIKKPLGNTNASMDSFAWEKRFTSWPLETSPQNGVVSQYAACWYNINYQPENTDFCFYLVPTAQPS